MNKKTVIAGIIVVAIVAIVACGGVYFFNKNKIENNMNEGNKLMASKDYRGALKEYETVLNEDSGNTEAKQREDILNGYLRAEEYYKNGDLEKSKVAIDSITGYNKYEIASDIDTLKDNINKKEEVKQKEEEQKIQEQKQAQQQDQVKKEEKQRYLNELDELKSITDKMNDGETQGAMNSQSGQVYTLWDNKLNEIWKVLESQLLQPTMSALRTKQNAWIEAKESKKKEVQEQYEGGSIMPLMVNSALASMTEERCYYLVNNYM